MSRSFMGERSGFVSKGKELSCEIRRGWWLRGGAAWEQVCSLAYGEGCLTREWRGTA